MERIGNRQGKRILERGCRAGHHPRVAWAGPWLCVLLVLAGAPRAGQAQEAGAAAVAVASDAAVPRAGDVIRLRIWREPDLSGDFPVDADGFVVFPRFGAQEVTRESAESLRARLVAAYSRHLNHTAIEVTVLRRVQVLGSVRQPGIFNLEPTMTIGDAVAIAGGMTSQGHPSRVELRRDGRTLDVRLARETRIDRSPIRSGDQLYVPERSWFSRNTGLIATGISAGMSLFIAAVVR